MVPFLGTLNIRCRIIIGTQKGTIILTTTQVVVEDEWSGVRVFPKRLLHHVDFSPTLKDRIQSTGSRGGGKMP